MSAQIFQINYLSEILPARNCTLPKNSQYYNKTFGNLVAGLPENKRSAKKSAKIQIPTAEINRVSEILPARKCTLKK
jgi:hypothetical protein